MIDQVLLFIASYIANMMSAFAGGGAGLVQLPVLLLLGLPFPVALGTHKIANVALGLGAASRFIREENLLELKFSLFILCTGMLGAIAGAYLIIHIPDDLARLILGVLIIALGIYALFKKQMGLGYSPKNRDQKGILIGGACIFLMGIFNGSFTAGAGLFVTMFLILWFGMDYKRAVAYTMTLVGIFWNATGAFTLYALGEPIHWPWIPVLLLGSFLGGYTGAHFNTLKGNKWVKIAFTAITLISGAMLLLKS